MTNQSAPAPRSRLVTAHAVLRAMQRIVDFRVLRLDDLQLKSLIDRQVDEGVAAGRFKLVHNVTGEPQLFVGLRGALSRTWAVVRESGRPGPWAQAVVTLLSNRQVEISLASGELRELEDHDAQAA